MSDASKNNEENTRLLTELKTQLMKMDVQKQTLEAEAQAIVQELTLPGENGEPPMGIDTPLVDFDGFPRADIDLYRARSLRKRFHEIQTDHKELLRQIEVGLAKINMLQVGTFHWHNAALFSFYAVVYVLFFRLSSLIRPLSFITYVFSLD